MGKAACAIERINWCIKLMRKEEFTIEDLMKTLKEYYPRWTPQKKALYQYLKWPKINAEKLKDNGKFNGKYRKINQ